MEINTIYRKYIALAMAASLAAGAFAQDGPLRGNVVVNGQYLPDVIRQDRINTLPHLYNFTMEQTPLKYEFRGVRTPFAPTFTALPTRGWQTDRALRTYRGYADLQLGSWLNSNLSAGYRFVDDESDTFGVRLQHNSTSLFKPHMADYADNVRKFNYDDVIGLYYRHTFDGTGRLDASADYHVGYFNYYGYYAPLDSRDREVKAPTQTLNDIFARVGWSSLPDAPFEYDAALKLRYYGYRALYLPGPSPEDPELSTLYNFKGQRETHVGLDGGAAYSFDSSSSLGARLTGDILSYSDPEWRENQIDGYGALGVHPYYRFQRGNLFINLGARLDFTFGAGPKGDRASVFHIAPDVRLDYRAGIAGLYFHALGGTRLNTLASQGDADYYGLPALLSTNPVYSPLDATAGIAFGPVSGLTAGLEFRYKVLRNQPILGLYTMYLNGNYSNPASNIVADPLGEDGMNIHGWSVGANIKYELPGIVKIGVEGSYQPQNGKKGYYNGIDRPRWLLTASAEVNPVEKLSVEVQYNYRGVRNVCCPQRLRSTLPDNITTGGDAYQVGYDEIRLPDLTDLSARVSYAVTPAVTVSVQADNILARKIELLPDVKSQGITVLGGVSVTF